jgi:hypothetical protein
MCPNRSTDSLVPSSLSPFLFTRSVTYSFNRIYVDSSVGSLVGSLVGSSVGSAGNNYWVGCGSLYKLGEASGAYVGEACMDGGCVGGAWGGACADEACVDGACIDRGCIGRAG